MDMLKKLSLNAQLVLLGSILYVILSFLNWQNYHGLATWTEWTGIGVIPGLIVLILLAWELARGFDLKIAIGSLSPALVSVVLAEALLLFTVITFLNLNYHRAFASYLGLLVAIGIGVVAFLRAKDEGVQMPTAASSGDGGAAV
jgi:hypothetical protein